jgi:hypothetical protein
MLEEPGHQVFLGRQRDQAVAQIARRGEPTAPAQPSGATPVVGHGHDGDDVVQFSTIQHESEPAQNVG